MRANFKNILRCEYFKAEDGLQFALYLYERWASDDQNSKESVV